MKRIALIIEYDGTQYIGWQVQPLISLLAFIPSCTHPDARTAEFMQEPR